MTPLDKALRSDLERKVKQARELAEEGVRASLLQLGVGDAEAPAGQRDTENKLRRRLRTHGRQLGDVLKTNGTQEVERLIEELAYEHWHRMLFARFLAENHLLMYEGVAVTLEECKELSEDTNIKCEWKLHPTANAQWELAGKLAAKMLPQIFRPDSPAFELTLPPEHEQKLEALVAALSPAVFQATDALGWLYQFWQAKRKDDINASEVKIGARELPAVTQLFTEPYMVSFLLDNALGAWWASQVLTDADLQHAQSEQELRTKASLPGVPLDYLRFAKDGNAWKPAAGYFEAWPKELSEFTMLDPSCGSGHFLVSVFLMLVPLRMRREGLNARDAVQAVLAQNIHGLELDPRCVELAVFALALEAWRYPGAGGYRNLPELQVACSGLSVSAAKEEWKALASENKNIRIALDWLYDTFADAPVLGSLINPAKSSAAKIVKWEELSAHLELALAKEQSEDGHEAGVVAQGLAKAASLLAGRYTWVVTNVPYLSLKKQDQRLSEFCEREYPQSKMDLATVFLERCLGLSDTNGTVSLVMPQNWLYLKSYSKLRVLLLTRNQWNALVRLGSGAFETISGEVVKAILVTISKTNNADVLDVMNKTTRIVNPFVAYDASTHFTSILKSESLSSVQGMSLSQTELLNNPDSRIVIDDVSEGEGFSEFAISMRGIVSGDNDRWKRLVVELPLCANGWRFLQTTPQKTIHFTGMELLIDWRNQGAEMLRPGLSNSAYGEAGIAIGQIGDLPATIYDGSLYDNNTGVIVPKNKRDHLAMWCYCASNEYHISVRKIDQTLKVTNATLVKVPFDLAHWTQVAAEKYPNGLPQPYTNDPTQWIFHGHPCGSVIWNESTKRTDHGAVRIDNSVLQIAVARLMGYRWPAELDPAMELAPEQREWVQRCEALLSHGDDDGVVCIPPVRGEINAADRLLSLLAQAYGEQWNNTILDQLLTQVGYGGKTLEAWLRNGFFEQHCKLFGHRPFVWNIWDGLSDGFSVLVNYHKLDTKLLESIIYTYLGDWIAVQKQTGNEERLAAALVLKKNLELILAGEAPYDIFVRWKPLNQQPIGWNPDLNDGVRLNIRPFMTVPDVKVKDAGILRTKPNIKWDKDRGKDVESAPWYKVFNGDRVNDHHLSLEEKRNARSGK